jgi:hypothetical protein
MVEGELVQGNVWYSRRTDANQHWWGIGVMKKCAGSKDATRSGSWLRKGSGCDLGSGSEEPQVRHW